MDSTQKTGGYLRVWEQSGMQSEQTKGYREKLSLENNKQASKHIKVGLLYAEKMDYQA